MRELALRWGLLTFQGQHFLTTTYKTLKDVEAVIAHHLPLSIKRQRIFRRAEL